MSWDMMIVLVPDVTTRDRVRDVAASRFDHSERGMVVQLLSGRVDACVREVRANLGQGPMAVIVADEPSALDALGAGADEALALTHPDDSTILLLLDRARLRGEFRKQQEHRFASLAQLEKLSALGILVAGVAHEINNPLTGALLSLEMLKNELSPLYEGAARIRTLAKEGRAPSIEELRLLAVRMRSGSAHTALAREIISDVERACESIAEIVKDLCIYARAQENEPREVVDLRSLLEKIMRLMGRDVGPNVHIQHDFGDYVPPVMAQRTRLTQVLTSLLANALHAIREQPRDMHRLRVGLRADDEVVTITVEDTGPGIVHEALERIFDPFVTSPRDAAGAGLSLSVARSIMRSLGGDLVVESVHGDGATFVAWLPRPETRHVALDTVETKTLRRVEARRSILLVEPDTQVLGALARLLRDRYDVLIAMDGQEAVELLSSGSHADLVLSEADTYDATGMRFCDWLARERPELAQSLILTTARPDLTMAMNSVQCLEKPIDPQTLLRCIEEQMLATAHKARDADNTQDLRVLRC
jgi:signal transduction histidine kinase/ActR/RegA family two-component response regulator